MTVKGDRGQRWVARVAGALLMLAVTSLVLIVVMAAIETSVAATDQGPQPVMTGPFRPSQAQLAYFLHIATSDFGKQTCVIRWAPDSTVHVMIAGPCRLQDVLILREILQTVSRAVGSPRFICSSLRPSIVISFPDQRAFEEDRDNPADNAAAWCESSTGRSGFTDAEIVVKDTPDSRAYRSLVLYHEFGHALGLGDTKSDVYSSTVMYYRVRDDAPTRFTNFDLAALRMLYDQKVDPGDTRRQMVRLWSSCEADD